VECGVADAVEKGVVRLLLLKPWIRGLVGDGDYCENEHQEYEEAETHVPNRFYCSLSEYFGTKVTQEIEPG